MFPLLRYPRVMQVICTLGALSECVGNHQLLPSLLPPPFKNLFCQQPTFGFGSGGDRAGTRCRGVLSACQARPGRGLPRKINPTTISSVAD